MGGGATIFTTLFPPQQSRPIHGVGVPIQDTDPNAWYATHPDVPFLTWDSRHGDKATHWPMIWRDEPLASQYPSRTPILLLNEPDLVGQADISPAHGAEVIRRYRDWPGSVYGCGCSFLESGWEWFDAFEREIGGDIGILNGLHIHPYCKPGYLSHVQWRADKWRAIQDRLQLPFVLSEWGTGGGTTEQYQEMQEWCIDNFDPIAMFIFSWRYHLLPGMDLAHADGSLTYIGRWWFAMRRHQRRLYLPYVQP